MLLSNCCAVVTSPLTTNALIGVLLFSPNAVATWLKPLWPTTLKSGACEVETVLAE